MKLIVANWKANPATLEEARELAARSDLEGVVVCPPFVFLEEAGKLLSRAALGAQDLFFEGGAHTGQVSPDELKHLGVRFVIVGHSERRSAGETDEIVAKKLAAALAFGMTPILCIGEPRAVRDAGASAADSFVMGQLERALEGAAAGQGALVVAYEPIWAIGSGLPETREGAEEIIGRIKERIPSARVLYGGSVTSANAGDFLGSQVIDGVLVGGASLDAEEFVKIVMQAGGAA